MVISAVIFSVAISSIVGVDRVGVIVEDVEVVVTSTIGDAIEGKRAGESSSSLVSLPTQNGKDIINLSYV